jgi:hypothetical protein
VTPATANGVQTIELMVVDHDLDRVGRLVDSGVRSFLVDW